MVRRSVDACPKHKARWYNETLRSLSDVLPFADVAVGAAIGYASVVIYFTMITKLAVVPVLGTMIWRELVLISVMTALVVRDADNFAVTGHRRSSELVRAVLHRTAYAGVILLAVGLATGTLHDMARLWLLMWAVAFVTWMLVSRLLLLTYEQYLTQSGNLREAVAVIGARASVDGLLVRLKSQADVLAVVDYSSGDHTSMVATLSDVITLAREGTIGLVVLAVGQDEPHDLAHLVIEHLKATPVQVAICRQSHGLIAASPLMRTFAGVPMTLVADRPLNRHDLLAKLVLDKCGALVLLALVSPMLAAVALAVLFETPGPVLFRQARSGWFGRLFTVYKFRTMWHVPGEIGLHQTSRNDPRCTRVGSFLRRTSLDELPQLWNVLCGDMSLVGPRPHADILHAHERNASHLTSAYAQRQRVKPGLTGWAQVHGLRGAADTVDKLRRRVELDLYYIDNWSIWLDLQILARTPLAILSAENAF